MFRSKFAAALALVAMFFFIIIIAFANAAHASTPVRNIIGPACCYLAAPVLAQAMPAASGPDDSVLVKLLLSSVTGGNYAVAFGALLLLLAAGARWLAADDTPVPVGPVEKVRVFFHTSLGGYVVVFAVSACVTFGGALAAGTALSLHLVEATLGMTIGTTGTFAFVRGLYQAWNAYKAGVLPPGHPALAATPNVAAK